MTSELTQADVAQLTTDPSPQARADAAAKIAAQFDERKLSDVERQIAEDIFRVLMKDAEVRVREALAEHLKSSPDLPHDVALGLANDVESVALPILQFCEVLSDQDLIEIVRGEEALKQVAIAQRSRVSAEVAETLIDTGNETAVTHLVTNEGAELNEDSIGRVLIEYAESQAVSGSLARRPDLPAAVSEQLMNVVTQQLQSYLVKQHKLPPEMVKDLVLQAREQATTGLLTYGCSNEAEVEQLIDQLHVTGRLSPSVALRALSMGDLAFFEMAMARLANIPVENARALIHDQGNLGINSILEAVNC